jgi:hypothetical protein
VAVGIPAALFTFPPGSTPILTGGPGEHLPAGPISLRDCQARGSSGGVRRHVASDGRAVLLWPGYLRLDGHPTANRPRHDASASCQKAPRSSPRARVPSAAQVSVSM